MDVLARNLADLTRQALGHAAPTPALVVYDTASTLSRALTEGYRTALPHAAFLDFAEPAGVRAALGALPAGSLVVLVQSTRFDMGDFRFRLELFRLGMHVVEHPHVGRIADDEVAIYVDALAYDPAWYRGLGAALRDRIDAATRIELRSSLGTLTYAGPFERARLNVGDYRGMPNVGGQFPIGEVFTELVDLDGLNGVGAIDAYGAADFSVAVPPEPFRLEVARGRVVGAPGAPREFAEILDAIAAEEGEVWVRELGFGLNRAFTRTRRVRDISAYERMCGVHLSLGAKHPVYPKAGFNKRHTRFHVDVFCVTDEVCVDHEVVYAGDRYVIGLAYP